MLNFKKSKSTEKTKRLIGSHFQLWKSFMERICFEDFSVIQLPSFQKDTKKLKFQTLKFYWLKVYWKCNMNQLNAQINKVFCTIVTLGCQIKYLYILWMFLWGISSIYFTSSKIRKKMNI